MYVKSTERTKTIYILFSRSGTWFSRLIHIFAGGDYTHVSIGLDSPQGPFWSFGRLNPRRAFPGGFVQEGPDRGFFYLHPETPCALYTLQVSPRVYRRLQEKVTAMGQKREAYHYNLLGTASCFFGVPMARRNYYFCSQFVAEALMESGAVELGRTPALIRPMDLWGAAESDGKRIYRGKVGALPAEVESA